MLYKELLHTIDTLDTLTISKERKVILQPLIDFVQEKVSANKEVRLNFICTHNSRRSHLSQVWAQVLAIKNNIKIYSYSGGTEATALFIEAKNTLERNGLKIQQLSDNANPVYAIKYAENELPIIGFSKKYDDTFNPTSEFAAILTCSSADKGCPFIVGAEKRIPITCEDPKAFDNTPLQKQMYSERSLQIATEMSYVFSNIK